MSNPRRVGGLLLALVATGLLVLVAACGTIMHGSSQGIGFASNPTGAAITIDNQTHGQTPTIVNLSRKDTHLVRIDLDGYKPFETTITRHVSGWIWGNIVFGGIIGLAVDAISGGLYKLSPDQLQAELAKNDVSIRSKKDVLYLTVTLKPDPSWQKVAAMVPVPGD